MIKVYQTINDEDNANCMQAAIASLFNEKLDNVPNFISFGDKWWWIFKRYIKYKGYNINKIALSNTSYYGKNISKEYLFDRLKSLEGINDLFYATVSSPKFNPNGDLDGHTHAVIIDKYFNIIHDPKIEYNNIIYPRSNEGYNGIRQILIFDKII